MKQTNHRTRKIYFIAIFILLFSSCVIYALALKPKPKKEDKNYLENKQQDFQDNQDTTSFSETTKKQSEEPTAENNLQSENNAKTESIEANSDFCQVIETENGTEIKCEKKVSSSSGSHAESSVDINININNKTEVK